MDTKGRILYYSDSKGIKVSELEKMLSLGRNYFKNTSKVSVDVVVKFLSVYSEVSPEWVLTGEGSIIKENSRGFTYYDKYVDGAIPFYKDLPASAGQLGLSKVEVNEKPSGWIKPMEVLTAIGAFPVVGCSMEPFIHPGDFIAVSPMNNWDRLDPDKTYMIVTREDRMIKHLSIDNDDPDILWCISPNYPKFKICKQDVLAIWRITFHGKMM